MLGDFISNLTDNWLHWMECNNNRKDPKKVKESEELINNRYSNIEKIDQEINDKTRDRIIN